MYKTCPLYYYRWQIGRWYHLGPFAEDSWSLLVSCKRRSAPNKPTYMISFSGALTADQSLSFYDNTLIPWWIYSFAAGSWASGPWVGHITLPLALKLKFWKIILLMTQICQNSCNSISEHFQIFSIKTY